MTSQFKSALPHEYLLCSDYSVLYGPHHMKNVTSVNTLYECVLCPTLISQVIYWCKGQQQKSCLRKGRK